MAGDRAGLETFTHGIPHGRFYQPRARRPLNNPGQVRTEVPMLIVQGIGDNQVPAPLTDQFVSRMACPIGDHVDVHYTGATHDQIPFRAAPLILSWATSRLNRVEAPDTCGEQRDFAIKPAT